METNQCQIDKAVVNEIFRNIEERNSRFLDQIQEEKKEIDNKVSIIDNKMNSLINFVQFRNKVDKIEACYHLMISQKQIKEMRKVHEKTENELFSKALEKSNGNELKAISLLFDPSCDIYV